MRELATAILIGALPAVTRVLAALLLLAAASGAMIAAVLALLG